MGDIIGANGDNNQAAIFYHETSKQKPSIDYEAYDVEMSMVQTAFNIVKCIAGKTSIVIKPKDNTKLLAVKCYVTPTAGHWMFYYAILFLPWQ